MRKLPYILTLILVWINPQAAEFPELKEIMTERDMQATGVHKLTDEEKAVLRRWLWAFVDNHAEFYRLEYDAPDEYDGGKEDLDISSDVINSRIKGEFVGWEGNTVFELENGQVWQQRRKNRFRHKAQNPEVIIKKNIFGFYEMEVVEAGRKIQVKRIR